MLFNPTSEIAMELEVRTVADEIKSWIEEAALNTGSNVSVVTDAKAQELTTLINERYVFGLPGWWWAQLKKPCSKFDRNVVRLSQILPSLESEIYLIPEYPNHEGPIFKISARDVEAVLNDCPLFEYNLLGDEGGWLISESHHDVIYLCKSDDGLTNSL
ncbi:hypothetical protein [Silvibacterium dinghuense]|uniref:Uncharacterized protein n=1 Tax=Silvibacterium dinghuense TaxID=1560006 RepID=A0A4Q1SD26_9BACT|nr:hypothetical protein [Silvibacterium dinghuense]RXS95122.1 hypothetical protein ESZ00_10955 [Silvibacterium dinghuense]GGH10822.1 hypothetical protein GCM10011586_29320 [Silvibacterium dinghuense]